MFLLDATSWLADRASAASASVENASATPSSERRTSTESGAKASPGSRSAHRQRAAVSSPAN
jgi:hypothetical protein